MVCMSQPRLQPLAECWQHVRLACMLTGVAAVQAVHAPVLTFLQAACGMVAATYNNDSSHQLHVLASSTLLAPTECRAQ
jgi:hypothetical protein